MINEEEKREVGELRFLFLKKMKEENDKMSERKFEKDCSYIRLYEKSFMRNLSKFHHVKKTTKKEG